MSGDMRRGRGFGDWAEIAGAWLLGLIWIAPLLYAFWSAFHPPEYATHFRLFAPLTLDNFRIAWSQAPFPRYFLHRLPHYLRLQFLLFPMLHPRRMFLHPRRRRNRHLNH